MWIRFKEQDRNIHAVTNFSFWEEEKTESWQTSNFAECVDNALSVCGREEGTVESGANSWSLRHAQRATCNLRQGAQAKPCRQPAKRHHAAQPWSWYRSLTCHLVQLPDNSTLISPLSMVPMCGLNVIETIWNDYYDSTKIGSFWRL